MKDIKLTPFAQLAPSDAQDMAQRFGNALRDARERLGLRLRDVQRESGFSLGYLSDLEHGRRWATHDAAWRLEVALSRLAGAAVEGTP